MPKINPLVAIALPTWGNVSVDWALAFKNLGGPLGTNIVQLAPVVGKPIAEARNELMAAAIANGCDFIFFIGDDVIAQPDTIHRLLYRMWEHPEINMVTGVYWTRTHPTQPYIWRGVQRGPYMDWKYGEFFEVDYAGIDCLMIRLTDEMKALGPEWFSTEWQWEATAEKTTMLLPTEDFFFYTKARKAGMKLWCDTLVQCIHQDRNTRQQFALTTDMPQYGAAEPEYVDAETDAAPLVKIADIGCGFEGPFFGSADKVKVVRFDANEKVKPDYRCDIRKLPVEDQSFDVVHSRHVLEHFGRAETMKVLKEWTRILRVGGEFHIAVPNLLYAVEQIALMEYEAIPPYPYPFWQLYGQQSDEYDIHKNGFTPRRMELLLKRLGIFEDIEVRVTGTEEFPNINIEAKARKVKHLEPYALLPVWDEIEKAEGIQMEGLRDREPEPEPVKSRVAGSASWFDRDAESHREWQEGLKAADPVGYAARNGNH